MAVSQLLKEQTLLLPEEVPEMSNAERLKGSGSAVEGADAVAARAGPGHFKCRASERHPHADSEIEGRHRTY